MVGSVSRVDYPVHNAWPVRAIFKRGQGVESVACAWFTRTRRKRRGVTEKLLSIVYRPVAVSVKREKGDIL